jgi:hypothetical protein
VRPRGGPACRDKVVLAEHEVDLESKVTEGSSEVLGDLRLASWTGESLARPEVVANVVAVEDG